MIEQALYSGADARRVLGGISTETFRQLRLRHGITQLKGVPRGYYTAAQINKLIDAMGASPSKSSPEAVLQRIRERMHGNGENALPTR